MSPELTILAWTLVLAVVQIMLPATLRTGETGLPYNAGPRDAPSPAPVGKLTGRLQRAQSNLYETLPLFAVAVLIAHVAGRESPPTLWGTWIYLIARIVYIPLYTLGIAYLRTIAFGTGLLGLGLVLIAILR